MAQSKFTMIIVNLSTMENLKYKLYRRYLSVAEREKSFIHPDDPAVHVVTVRVKYNGVSIDMTDKIEVGNLRRWVNSSLKEIKEFINKHK